MKPYIEREKVAKAGISKWLKGVKGLISLTATRTPKGACNEKV